MSDWPTISVVIPSYNAGRWIVEAVESVLAQTLPASEIIVVDDGSSDDTRQRLKPYLDRGVTYVYQENRGVSAARNNGIGTGKGQFIAFLDADDVWHPRKLELQYTAMAKEPELAMLGTATFEWPSPVPDVSMVSLEQTTEWVPLEKLLVKNQFTASSVMVRHEVLMELGDGPFDQRLQGPEDYDLWIRIATIRPVGNLKLPLTGYREHTSGLGNHPRKMEAGMRRILQKLDASAAWSRVRGRWVRGRAYAYFHFSCACMNRMAGNDSAALAHAIRSLAWYPLPFKKAESRIPWVRIKFLTVTIFRLICLSPHH